MDGKEGGRWYLVVFNVLFYRMSLVCTPVSHHKSISVSFSRKITIGKECTYLWRND